MKTTINPLLAKAAEPQKYPFIGKYTSKSVELVVYFTQPTEGLVLQCSSYGWKAGAFSRSWEMDHFEPFKGSVTLAND